MDIYCGREIWKVDALSGEIFRGVIEEVFLSKENKSYIEVTFKNSSNELIFIDSNGNFLSLKKDKFKYFYNQSSAHVISDSIIMNKNRITIGQDIFYNDVFEVGYAGYVSNFNEPRFFVLKDNNGNILININQLNQKNGMYFTSLEAALEQRNDMAMSALSDCFQKSSDEIIRNKNKELFEKIKEIYDESQADDSKLDGVSCCCSKCSCQNNS